MCESDSEAARNQSPAPNEPAAPLDCCGGLNNVDYSKVFARQRTFQSKCARRILTQIRTITQKVTV